MKHILFILTMSLLVLPATAQSPNIVKTQYNKFRDVSTISIDSIQAVNLKGTDLVMISVLYTFQGKTPTQPAEDQKDFSDTMIVSYGVKSDGCSENDLELRFLIDGQIEGPYYAHLHKALSAGDCMYMVNGSTTELVRKIASAKKVEGQIDSVEFELPASGISKLKMYFDALPKLPSRVAISHDPTKTRVEFETYAEQVIKLKNADHLIFRARCFFKGNAQSEIENEEVLLQMLPGKNISEGDDPELKIYVDNLLFDKFETHKARIAPIDSQEQLIFTTSKSASARIIEKIAKAKKVRCTFGATEFELSQETIEQFRMLYNGTHKG